jgi:thiamine pyrophosphokinase
VFLLNRVIIFANGELNDPTTAQVLLQPTDTIIAADGGARHCRTLGITPHILIGDLDSATPSDIAMFEAAGTQVLKYPTHKDQTDLELALDWAVAHNATHIIILGALGGRWDQTLANLLLPALPTLQGLSVQLLDGNQNITTVRGPGTAHFNGNIGDTVSLIPISGDVHGVTTANLEYPLSNATLAFGSTLGISNTLTASQATVSITQGLLVCITISNLQGLHSPAGSSSI